MFSLYPPIASVLSHSFALVFICLVPISWLWSVGRLDYYLPLTCRSELLLDAYSPDYISTLREYSESIWRYFLKL